MNKHNLLSNSNYLFLHHQFDDFDELATTIKAWDLDFRQLDRGQSKANLSQIIGANVAFSHAHFNRHYHQQGSTPPGMRTFGISEDHVTGINWFGHAVTPSSLLCFPTSKILEAVSKPNFEVYTISFSEQLLAKVANLYGLPELDDILINEEKLANGDPKVIHNIRILLRKVRYLMQQGSKQVNNIELQQLLENELPARILNALSDSLSVTYAKPTQRKKRQAIKKTCAYINEHPTDPVLVNDLCQYADVSVRTLENAFKEYYGVTPKHYLRATRLNGAYKEIRDVNSPLTTISDIANKWGFWHMGQFAKDYRLMYGTLPSQMRRLKN